MQDRFRFRVWFTPDYQEPEMIYDAEQTYDNRCRNKGSFHHESFDEVLEDKDCVVMQCTGLKDKNGKLIYEGDIVEKSTFIDYNGNGYQPDVYLDRVDIGVVHFTASNGAVLRKVKTFLTDDPYKEREPLPKKDQPKMVKLFAYRSEIIGNIYENPELLEVQNADNE